VHEKPYSNVEIEDVFMDDRDLRKLSRQELLEILLEITAENEALKEENIKLRKKLKSKAMMIEKAGNLAEASLKISAVFERAQLAADIYLRNIRQMEEQLKRKQAFLDGAVSKEEYEASLQNDQGNDNRER
jgi:hypothetical protein